ncbi:MAG TPA: class I SAM-dependent methyltransferase, partial [Acidobacteriota bacterium]
MKPTVDFDSIAEAWQKWEEILEPCFGRLNELLLEKAVISEKHHVLDLGCGSGIPALLIAKRVTKGKVIGVDISEPMVAVARRKVDALKLNNISFQNHDIHSLPFEASSFDAVTARFSLMFVETPQNTINEVFRVLRNRGRFSVCVWGDPQKNPLPRNVLGQYCEVPSNNPDVPGPYRFADKGRLAALMN